MLLALALATTAATAAPSTLTDAQLDAFIARTHQHPFAQRIAEFSAAFLGTPYGEFRKSETSCVMVEMPR